MIRSLTRFRHRSITIQTSAVNPVEPIRFAVAVPHRPLPLDAVIGHKRIEPVFHNHMTSFVDDGLSAILC